MIEMGSKTAEQQFKEQLEEGLELIIQYEKRGGFVPAVAQDFKTGEILMLAYVNQQAFEETLKSGYATFWSTSRNELWTKGKKGGDLMEVIEILVDCDQDALVYKVEKLCGGACHTKDRNGEARSSCFYRKLGESGTKLKFIETDE